MFSQIFKVVFFQDDIISEDERNAHGDIIETAFETIVPKLGFPAEQITFLTIDDNEELVN